MTIFLILMVASLVVNAIFAWFGIILIAGHNRDTDKKLQKTAGLYDRQFEKLEYRMKSCERVCFPDWHGKDIDYPNK